MSKTNTRVKHRIKTGDLVQIQVGKDKGRQGKVIKVINRNSRILLHVENLNMVKKCIKANPSQEKPGAIISQEAAIDISNVAIVNRETGKPDRLGFKLTDDGRKVRIYKSTQTEVDATPA